MMVGIGALLRASGREGGALFPTLPPSSHPTPPPNDSQTITNIQQPITMTLGTASIPINIQFNTTINTKHTMHDQQYTRIPVTTLLTQITRQSIDQHTTTHDSTQHNNTSQSDNTLWVDKYAPSSFRELLSDGKINRRLLTWIKSWDKRVFQNDQSHKPEFTIAILAGAPGTGKSTIAKILSKHCGYNIVEINASDERSQQRIARILQDSTENTSIFSHQKPNCLILDEIDGATGGDEKGAISELVNFAKKGKGIQRPIFCIANDLYSKALKPLRTSPFVRTFSFGKTKTESLASRLAHICQKEGIKADFSQLKLLCDTSHNDVRCCLNTLQFYHSKRSLEDRFRVEDMQVMHIGDKDSSPQIFDVWNRIFSKKPNGLNEAAEVSSSFGDFDVLLSGIHENFLSTGYSDPSLDKTTEVLTWLCFSDIIESGSVSNLSHFLASSYSPWVCSGISLNCSVKHNVRLQYPRSFSEHRAHKLRNGSILSSFLSNSTSCQMSALGRKSVTVEFLPYVERILEPSPRFHPRGFQSSSYNDSFYAQLSDTMISLGLTFRNEKESSAEKGVDSMAYKLTPEVNLLTRFPGLSKHYALSEEIKQRLSHEIHLEEIRRNSISFPMDTEANGQQVPESTSGQVSDVRSNVQKRCLPSNSFIQTMGLSKRRKIARIKPDLHFKFHEGFSNAVRRNVTIRMLLPQ